MNPIEKKYAKSAQKMIIFECGLAVSEMRQAKIEVLHERMVEQYRSRLDVFDPVSDEALHDDFSGKSYTFTLRDCKVEIFKQSIEESDGKKMWKAFTNLKSELVNHWLPHFSIQSGWDLDDAVERVRMHAWAHRANKNIKKNNRKAELEGREVEEEKLYTDAPLGCTSNIQLELPVVKKYHDHVFLQVNQRGSEELGTDSENEEDGRFQSIVSSLKKRKVQRKEQKEYDKKRRGPSSGNSGGGGDEKFEMQAAAANRQIAVAESKNMIEFLQMAQQSSMWEQDELKEMFVTARDNIFGASNAPAAEKDTMNDPSPSNDFDSDGDDIYN